MFFIPLVISHSFELTPQERIYEITVHAFLERAAQGKPRHSASNIDLTEQFKDLFATALSMNDRKQPETYTPLSLTLVSLGISIVCWGIWRFVSHEFIRDEFINPWAIKYELHRLVLYSCAVPIGFIGFLFVGVHRTFGASDTAVFVFVIIAMSAIGLWPFFVTYLIHVFNQREAKSKRSRCESCGVWKSEQLLQTTDFWQENAGKTL